MIQKQTIPVFVCGEIGLVHSLGIAGIPVYAGSNYPENIGLYSRFVKQRILFPPYDTGGFITGLRDFGKKLQHKSVFLTDDDQVVCAVSHHKEALQKYFLFTIPSPEVVGQIQDKWKFYKAAQSCGLPVPVTFLINSMKDLWNVSSRILYPCILKPLRKQDWWDKKFTHIVGPYKKAIRCANTEELHLFYHRIARINPRVILQESIEGEDSRHYSINMYINESGMLQGYYIYKKIRMYPNGAGRGSFIVTIHNDEVLDEAMNAATEFGMRGLMNIQFKRDIRAGKLKLIEIEPHLSGSNFLGPASGVNLAALYYNDHIGKLPEKEFPYHSDVKYSELLRDIKAFVQYRKTNHMSFAKWMRSYRGKFVFNGYLLRDPYPILKKIWFGLKKRF